MKTSAGASPCTIPQSDPVLPVGSFFGETVHERRIDGFSLNHSLHKANSRIPIHSHQSAYFCLVLRGEFTEAVDRKTRECGAGCVIFHPGRESHTEQFHAAGSLFNLEIEPLGLRRMGDLSSTLACPFQVQGGEQAWLTTRLYHEFRQKDTASSLAMEGLILELLAATSRQTASRELQKPPPWLNEIREMLAEMFLQPVSLNAMAEAVGVHPVYLARTFRQHCGSTMGEYVRRLRVEFAARQICASNAALGEIAAEAGFYDQSHFIRTFKFFVGMTPAQYRAAYRA